MTSTLTSADAIAAMKLMEYEMRLSMLFFLAFAFMLGAMNVYA